MAFKMNRRKDSTDEEVVESRLRHFINKYYRVKIIQGLIITISFTLVILFCLIIFGNVVPVGQRIRNFTVIAGGIVLAITFIIFIIKPLAQRFGIIQGLNFKEASSIIQQKHKSIEDRIVNIIELTREKAGQNNILYDYAIAQKTTNIQDINFNDAVSLKKLGVFAIRLVLLVTLCLGILLIWPDFVKKGIGAIWSDNGQIADLKRIKFVILNDSLEVESGKDFLLRFQVLSKFPVDNIYLLIGSTKENVEKAKDGYEFLFKAVNSSVSFRISGNGIQSGEYVLKALKKPEIGGIQLRIIPPAYTGLESSIIEGDGNAEVPAGSRVVWSIKTVNTDELWMSDELDSIALKGNGNVWSYERIISKSTNYEILCRNKNGLFINYFYKISIVKDLYPSIEISENRDTTLSGDVYIQGIIQDDYGFSKLEVIEAALGNESIKEIKIKDSNIYENFYYTLFI